MGRFFDAVAAVLGVRQRIGYEAQAAIELEHLARSARSGRSAVVADQRPVRLRFGLDGHQVLDHRPLIRGLVDGLRDGIAPAVLALEVHRAVAVSVAQVAGRLAAAENITTVGLTGGVFQNVLLLRECSARLRQRGLTLLTHRLVPPNDGGLALGQAVVAALRTDQGGSTCA
jgi:hydrogenase maturation protein HypF